MGLAQAAAWILGGVAALALVAAGLGLRPDIPRQDVLAAYTMPDSHFLKLPDGSVAHVRISGEGPPVILLHGFSSSSWAWAGWTRALAASHRLIRIDAPGHGLTQMGSGADLSPDGNVAFIAAILDQLGVARAAFAGNSMGGAQAQRFAILHPERVSALILVDSAGPATRRVDGDIARVRRAATNPALRFLLLNGGGRIVMGQALKSGVYDNATITSDTVVRTDALYRAQGNRATLLAILEASSAGRAAPPEEIRAPTLVMQGEEDQLVPPEVARALVAAIPGARLVTYPRLGHTPHEEDPGRTAADARAFLAEAGW
jgi:pimeloyl-ACP methyl ester carboxylesterase